MPIKARSLRILRIYVNITASILPDSYIDQHPSETTTQIIGRHKQHLNLPMLHADKSDDAASMTGNNKSGDCTERLTYKRCQTLNIRFGKEMVAYPYGFIPQLQKLRYTLIGPLDFAENGWTSDHFAKIEHIAQNTPILHNWMVVMKREEIRHRMRINKAAFLIKGYCFRTLTGTDRHENKIIAIASAQILNHHTTVASSLKCRNHGNILEFTDAASFIGYNSNTYGFTVIGLQDEHLASLQITVDHGFLFVGEQQQIHIALFIASDPLEFHLKKRILIRLR